jgi:hypothetical protein
MIRLRGGNRDVNAAFKGRGSTPTEQVGALATKTSASPAAKPERLLGVRLCDLRRGTR